jgi:hypothetical protein
VQEAGQLEQQAAQIEQMQREALAGRDFSERDAASIGQAQDRLSHDIQNLRSNAQKADWNSASKDIMTNLVHGNVNRQRQIEEGLRSGRLSYREAGRLEGGQAELNRMQAAAAGDGYIEAPDQAQLKQMEQREDQRIASAGNDRDNGYRDRRSGEYPRPNYPTQDYRSQSGNSYR